MEYMSYCEDKEVHFRSADRNIIPVFNDGSAIIPGYTAAVVSRVMEQRYPSSLRCIGGVRGKAMGSDDGGYYPGYLGEHGGERRCQSIYFRRER